MRSRINRNIYFELRRKAKDQKKRYEKSRNKPEEKDNHHPDIHRAVRGTGARRTDDLQEGADGKDSRPEL